MSTRAHIVMLLLALLTIVFILRLVRRRRLRAKYSVLWLSIGIAIIVLALAPGLLVTVADALNVYYAPAVLLAAGLGFLLLLTLHFSWELSRLEDRTRALAEDNALLREQLDARLPPHE